MLTRQDRLDNLRKIEEGAGPYRRRKQLYQLEYWADLSLLPLHYNHELKKIELNGVPLEKRDIQTLWVIYRDAVAERGRKAVRAYWLHALHSACDNAPGETAYEKPSF